MDSEGIYLTPLKASHGEAWTLTEFQSHYQLDDAEAQRLFMKFGPYSNDLQVIMKAKLNRELASSPHVLDIRL